MASALKMIIGFFVCLVKVIWISLVALVRNIFPSKKKKDVTKEIVLVTGAGSGIGRLMALEFAKQGARLVLWDINEAANDAVRDEIEAMGRSASSYKVDCSKREEIYAAADKVRLQVKLQCMQSEHAPGQVAGKKCMPRLQLAGSF